MIGIVTLPDAFHPETQNEALHHGIVPTVAFTAHAGLQSMILKTADTRFHSHDAREIGAFETARFGRWSA